MRHVLGVLLALVMFAAVFVGAGWAVEKIVTLRASGGSLTTPHGVIALAIVAGVGLLLGILLAVPAVSPLAAGLPGLVLLGWTALLAVSERRAIQIVPLHAHSFAVGFGEMLTSGVLALAGAAMIIPLFVPSRWRRRYVGEDYYSDEPTGPASCARPVASRRTGAGPGVPAPGASTRKRASARRRRTGRPRSSRPAPWSRTAG